MTNRCPRNLDAPHTSYGYDAAGNLTTLVDPSNRVTTRTYDAASQVKSVNYSDPGTPDVSNIDYDALGQRTAMTDGTGTATWSWDSLNRLIATTNGAGSTLSYGHDLAGRVTTITYPGNRNVTRGYDGAGRWTTVTDWLGNTTGFGYDGNGNLDATTFPTATGNVDHSIFDTADRLMSTTMKKGTTTLASLTYGRDKSDLLNASTPTGLPATAETYGYSSLSQIKTLNGSESFGYDTADNLTKINGVGGLGYDNGDQLISVPHGGAPTTLAYDPQGNRTTVTTPAERSFAYGFDQANRLTSVATTNAFSLLDAGANHTAALRPDGTVWTWGLNTYGQLGVGDVTNRATATQVPGIADVTRVASGGNHTLVTRGDGTVWAWGRNANSELGDGTTTMRTTAVQVSGLLRPTAIAAGTNHSLALAPDGSVWAWGRNASGELGDGTITRRSKPTRVPGLSGVVAIAAGTSHSVAVKADGSVWAWGLNTSGQVGDGTIVNKTIPTEVLGVGGAIAAAGGATHTIVLKADGTVWGWGVNTNGQLGDGTLTNRPAPVQATGLTGVVAIDTGNSHNLARKADGSAWVWGYNGYGQLGDGTIQRKVVPTSLPAFASSLLSGGANFTVAVLADGTARSSGINASNQLGDGTITDARTPVTVTGLAGIAPGTLASYSYDGDGIRSSKSVLETTTAFTWDSTSGLPEMVVENDTAYIYGPGGMPVEQVTGSGDVTYLHHDHLGSTRLLTNATGANVASLNYDAYGAVDAATGTATTPFGFAGEYTDAETGFQYLRARYYDPSTGRFLNRDPLEALTRSPYAYADNNPINNTDPTGLFCIAGKNPNGSCRGSGAADAVVEAADDTVEFLDRNSGTIATAASVASFAVPGAGFVAVGFGAWSAYGNAREGDYVGAALDAVGVVSGGAALRLASRSASLSAASGRAVLGRGYLAPWLAQEAARYGSWARSLSTFSFGLSSLSEVRGYLGSQAGASTYAYC